MRSRWRLTQALLVVSVLMGVALVLQAVTGCPLAAVAELVLASALGVLGCVAWWLDLRS